MDAWGPVDDRRPEDTAENDSLLVIASNTVGVLADHFREIILGNTSLNRLLG